MVTIALWGAVLAVLSRPERSPDLALPVALVLAVAGSVLAPAWLVRRQIREQRAIAGVVRRIAGGDLCARVHSRSPDPEIAELAGGVDSMAEQLGLLLESQKRFVAHAAHELRAPITLVHGHLALALRRPRTEEEYRTAVEEALDSAQQLRLLAEELLDLCRVDAARTSLFEPTSVARAARGAARFVRADADRASITLDLRIEDALVSGSGTDLERMIRNLLENAVRHSPARGRVVVEATRSPGAVEIAVADEGRGVPEAERGRLFEPFFRGARERAGGSSGAGLGLAIVRAIAREHGGDVHLDPAALRGARFVVRLPCCEAPDSVRAPAREAREAALPAVAQPS
jgi:two-component system, OmpR family, sensor kinase